MITICNVFGQDAVVVETSPRDPVKGENFQIIFKCQTKGSGEPSINFTADGFEVLGRNIQGLSTKTIYQNGILTTQREILVVYEARADRVGRINLRDVVVKIDGKTIRESAVGIDVLAERREPTVVFLAAEVPKKEVYEGEGITVRYFIYTKVGLQSFDIKKYPKLDGFMKRYLQENENPQRVTVNGEIFKRSLIYAARLYPEKTGTLIVDPMDISTTYSNDPFGNLGFAFGSGLRDLKTRTISSEPVKVIVKALPSIGRPSSFTGLVGKHKIELKIGRTNLLVNEPLEAKLTVSGAGNLENMEAPALWNVPELEKFDAKSDLGLVGGESAIKTFEYTYLGRAPGEVKSELFALSYFDTETGKYETFSQELPELKVAGTANPILTQPKESDKNDLNEIEEPGAANPKSNVKTLQWWAQMGFWWSLLGAFIIFIFVWRGKAILPELKHEKSWEKEIHHFKNNQITNASMLKVFYHLASDENQTLEKIIQSSTLREEAKAYFLELSRTLMKEEYAKNKDGQRLKLEKKYAKDLRQAIRRKYADS